MDWARLQFARLTANRDSVSAGDQAAALEIVGEHADAPTFRALHALARSARDETEFRRFSDAMAAVPDAQLARQVLQLALSAEVPAQAESQRLSLVYAVADDHPALSYRFLKANVRRLFAANSVEDSVSVAQDVPEIYWDAAPVDEVVAWMKAHAPAEAAPELARGAERAKFHLVTRERLDAQADALDAR